MITTTIHTHIMVMDITALTTMDHTGHITEEDIITGIITTIIIPTGDIIRDKEVQWQHIQDILQVLQELQQEKADLPMHMIQGTEPVRVEPIRAVV